MAKAESADKPDPKPSAEELRSTEEFRRQTGELRQQIETLSSIASEPAFLEILAEIESAPEEERLAVATRLASLQTLGRRGLRVPAGTRLTTRYFEAPQAATRGDIRVDTAAAARKPGDGGGTTVCVSLGYLVCVTIGQTEAQQVALFEDLPVKPE